MSAFDQAIAGLGDTLLASPFSRTISYESQSIGSPANITAIVDHTQGALVKVFTKLSLLPAPPEERDLVTFDGKIYQVVRFDPDPYGFVTIEVRFWRVVP